MLPSGGQKEKNTPRGGLHPAPGLASNAQGVSRSQPLLSLGASSRPHKINPSFPALPQSRGGWKMETMQTLWWTVPWSIPPSTFRTRRIMAAQPCPPQAGLNPLLPNFELNPSFCEATSLGNWGGTFEALIQ